MRWTTLLCQYSDSFSSTWRAEGPDPSYLGVGSFFQSISSPSVLQGMPCASLNCSPIVSRIFSFSAQTENSSIILEDDFRLVRRRGVAGKIPGLEPGEIRILTSILGLVGCPLSIFCPVLYLAEALTFCSPQSHRCPRLWSRLVALVQSLWLHLVAFETYGQLGLVVPGNANPI